MFPFSMDRNTTGRAGEFYAAYALERYGGIECHHVDREGADLWCRAPNGLIFTVQVKTCASPKKTTTSNGIDYFYYRFHRASSYAPYDFFCFVVLDRHLIRLLPREHFKEKQQTFSFKESYFTPENQSGDLAAFVEISAQSKLNLA